MRYVDSQAMACVEGSVAELTHVVKLGGFDIGFGDVTVIEVTLELLLDDAPSTDHDSKIAIHEASLGVFLVSMR